MSSPLYVRDIASQAIGAANSGAIRVQGGTVLELLAQVTAVGASGTCQVDVEVRWMDDGPWLGIYSSTMTAADYRVISLGPNAQSAKPLGYEFRVVTTVATDAVTHGYAVFIR